MSVPRKNVFAVAVMFTIVVGSAGPAWRLLAQNRWTISTEPVQTLKARPAAPAVTVGDRGTTYHTLENKAVRVVTRFADVTAVAVRGPDGEVSTELKDLAGNDVATFRVHRVDADNDSLEFTMPGGLTRHAARRKGLRPSLDWSNEQAYSLWKDRASLQSASLEWQDMLIRPAGTKRRGLDSDALQTDTEWSGGFSATAIRKIGTHTSHLTKQQTTGVVFISAFKRDGVEIGFSQWWPGEQTLAWSFPGLTEGYLDAARLQPSGGWQFTPDMAWLNTQNLAFQQFHALVNFRSALARPQGWLDRIGAFIAPTLIANEPGCDYLHWLDQSIFRPCCDSHDRCYEKQQPSCGWSSWWMWWSSWQCTFCNVTAVYCFTSAPGSHVLHRFP
jgi:hypothetical protein